MNLINSLLYNYYAKQFYKENDKPINKINWNLWEYYDKKCEEYQNK